MLELDLHNLSVEELRQARDRLHADAAALAADRARPHAELEHLFAALEQALAAEYAARHALEEHQEIATALGIDDATGEWLAGA
jgi:hypothetical protein